MNMQTVRQYLNGKGPANRFYYKGLELTSIITTTNEQYVLLVLAVPYPYCGPDHLELVDIDVALLEEKEA